MRASTFSGLATAVIMVLLTASRAHATAEICGNSIDDDGNGLTDEGCYPSLTTGVCESPLSCGDTGLVSWSTGSLHYDLPPDVNPRVPYGPGIGFRRFYTSMYSPSGANPTSVNHTPLGPNWQHTYMTWLYAFNDGTTNRIVLHTSQGRDVYYTDAGACGSYECYTPQAGDHVLSLKYDATNAVYYLQLLTGETLKYNSVGQIIEIWDTVAPSPNKVMITWTSTTNGNVSTVTDASGERRLLFLYTNNLLTSVQFQLSDPLVGWSTQNTTNFDYANGVTRDATSNWFVPQTSTEWTNLLAGTGIPSPTNLWKCQEASGNLADSIGSATLTAHNSGGMTYAQTISGWTRKAVQLAEGFASNWQSASTLCNPATTKCTMFGIIYQPIPTTQRDVFSMGDGNGARADANKVVIIHNRVQFQEVWDGATTSGPTNQFALTHTWAVSADPVNHFTVSNVDGSSYGPTWATGTSASGYFTMGSLSLSSAPSDYLYMSLWNNAALTSAQQQTLVNRIKNGPGLSQVSIQVGSTSKVVQQYVYDGNGDLTTIKDGGGDQVAAFTYSSTAIGQVDLITTSRGTVGFEYASSRTGCTANTALYFNQGNTLSCSIDSDCGSGYMCGGKTGTGSTGTCFLAGRCLTTSSVNGESVITNVAPLGPGGGSCSGACTDVMQYAWTGAGTGNVNVIGREDPLSNYTSITYNSNGLPTQVGYGDTDSDPTDGGTNRTEYIFYDSTFPGRVAEVRRASDLDVNAWSCSGSNTTGCQRTLYCYGSSCSASCAADNQLCTIERDGTTLGSSGSNTTFSSKITYVHDSKGRISEIDGAVSGIKTLFEYYTPASAPLTDNFLKDYKIYKDATNFLEPQLTTYDFWGHPTSVKAPDGNFTCDTYDSFEGFLQSRRRAMAGQTDCTTSNGADLTTMWSRDTWLRLTALVRPDGGSVKFDYNSSGQLTTITRLDGVVGVSGDQEQFTYTPDSQVSKIDTIKSGGAGPIATQSFSYFASRRLQEIINPVVPSTFSGLVYDSAGKLTEIDGAGSLSKLVDHYDGVPGRDGRITSEERYKTSSISDAWSLLYAWMGGEDQVTDGDSKVTGSLRDDLGRLVKLSDPDLSGPSIYVFDAASRMTTNVEVLGGGANQQTHTFSYDYLDRRLNDDFQGSCPTTGTAHPEIQRTYDALPSGVTCPMTGGCNNLAGRLAYVETTLMCSSTYSSTDGALDQFTFYSYDANGRAVEEYITDDSGRIADHKFAYNTDGALSQVVTPSGMEMDWTYGSSNNSDVDLVTAMSYHPPGIVITILDSVKWFPFGPWQQYNWKATIGGTPLTNTVDRNVAYRITAVHGALQGTTENAKVAITEDALGRVTSRVYTPHDPTLSGLFDSYFTYDEQSRVLCESTTSGTCPTSGSTLKNNHDQADPFTHAGDWKEVLRPIPGSSGGTINNFNTTGTGYGTSHQVTDINQSNGTPAFGHTAIAYDARGLRSYDDNTTTLTNDRRDYTYDARRNLVNVRGQYSTGGVWHYYDVASAFDHKNRRVFKSFFDETTAKTAQWFYYYDTTDRLTEVRYTPDTSVSGTYSTFQLFWLENKLVFFLQTDQPSGTVSKRYVASDETDRPIQLWNWPSSGDATRVWAINPSAWGVDSNIVGASVFQPIMFEGQYQDVETAALENDGATVHRPGMVFNGFRTYDPFIGAYLQVDPLVQDTWSTYLYVVGDPIGKVDPLGRDYFDPERPGNECASDPTDGYDGPGQYGPYYPDAGYGPNPTGSYEHPHGDTGDDGNNLPSGGHPAGCQGGGAGGIPPDVPHPPGQPPPHHHPHTQLSFSCPPPSWATWDSELGGFWRRRRVGEAQDLGPCALNYVPTLAPVLVKSF